MTFTESNTVERMIFDSAAPKRHGEPLNIREDLASGWRGSLGGELRPARWDYVPTAQLPRQSGDVIVEPWVREALILLNPEIAGGADHHRPELQIHGRHGPPVRGTRPLGDVLHRRLQEEPLGSINKVSAREESR